MSRIWHVKQTQLLSFNCLFWCVRRLWLCDRGSAQHKSESASSLFLNHHHPPVVILELWGTRPKDSHPKCVEPCVVVVKKCGPFDSSKDIKVAERILFIQTCVCGCAPFSGQAIHTGGKPHVAFQGGDACWHSSRADLSAAVWPEEEKRVGPPLQVSTAL